MQEKYRQRFEELWEQTGVGGEQARSYLEVYKPFETLYDALQPGVVMGITVKARTGLGSVRRHLGTVEGKLEGYGRSLGGLEEKDVESWKSEISALKLEVTDTFTQAIGDLNSTLVTLTKPPPHLLASVQTLCSRVAQTVSLSHDWFHNTLTRVSLMQSSTSYVSGQLSAAARSLSEVRKQISGLDHVGRVNATLEGMSGEVERRAVFRKEVRQEVKRVMRCKERIGRMYEKEFTERAKYNEGKGQGLPKVFYYVAPDMGAAHPLEKIEIFVENASALDNSEDGIGESSSDEFYGDADDNEDLDDDQIMGGGTKPQSREELTEQIAMMNTVITKLTGKPYAADEDGEAGGVGEMVRSRAKRAYV